MERNAHAAAVAKYDAANTRQVLMKLNLHTDRDILDRLDSMPNKQGYLKRLIREDMRKVIPGEYITHRFLVPFFRQQDVIVCKRSALYMQGYISGFAEEREVTVYANDPGEYENVHYEPLPELEETIIVNGTRCTTPEQAILDMLKEGNLYDAELAEGIAYYYHTHGGLLEKLEVPEQLQDMYQYYLEWAKELNDEP